MSTDTSQPMVDQEKLDEFLGRFVGDLGAALAAPLVVIGDRLGLYRALAEHGPQTPTELADHTGCDDRYLTEWLAAQAAGGYVDYDAATERFSLTAEQAFALADPDSPAYVPGGLEIAMAVARDADRVAEAFRSGDGLGWHDHDDHLFTGTDRFFRPNYLGNLVSSWIPALDGVADELAAGCRVADVGCGFGSSTVIMAEAYPASTFDGFDYHDQSIDAARKKAAAAGVADRVRFEVLGGAEIPARGYKLITLFDCLHDMGDPAGCLRSIRAALARGGTVMIVEPRAGDRLADNLNPVGRVFYAASTLICTPNARAQHGVAELGAQAGEARLREIAEQAGFGRWRRAAETPFNAVYEARA
jgi:SAM-dependent methyltransferase